MYTPSRGLYSYGRTELYNQYVQMTSLVQKLGQTEFQPPLYTLILNSSIAMSVIKYNFLVLGAGVFVFCGLVWFIIRFSPSHASSLAVSGQDENSRILKKLVEISPYSEPAFRLLHLVSIDGAGDWPPRCNYRSWPATLLPYRDIYHELNHLLPTADACLDDKTNQARRFKYRGLMRKLLSDRIDLAEVEKVLSATENGNWDNFPLDAYNALYCTVAVCRHAYR